MYETLLKPIRYTADNILEVGIGDFKNKNGGSLSLWRKYFTKATIHAVDILSTERVLDELVKDKTVKLYTDTNAYDAYFISCIKNIKFDFFLLDDGPHTLSSQEKFIELYAPLLNENGILIIEDVQHIDWL